MNITDKIAVSLHLNLKQVEAAIRLLDEGATVPFIARYRKEMTQNLTDTHLRDIEEKLNYLRELDERREVILKSITEQNKLTPRLEQLLMEADNKSRLEDLYLPYKPKRKTKATMAREAGLEPLAMRLWEDSKMVPLEIAQEFLNPEKEITEATQALEGARQILMEIWSENAELTEQLREFIWDHAIVTSHVLEGKEEEGVKFADYFNYREAIKRIPSHRVLALFRGRREKFLRITLDLPDELKKTPEEKLAKFFNLTYQHTSREHWLLESAHFAWSIKLFPRIELDLMGRIRENAEAQAIQVFASNLRDLLMAAPGGAKVTMGLDPGFRTGVKVAIIDATGKLLSYTTIFPHPPQQKWEEALKALFDLCQQFKVELISIGNGTASRETDKLVSELIQRNKQLNLTKIVISEAGASVYSASKIGAEEFPELDVSYRGAVSIARRLQDPLAELVKIEPKSIGVGQYQHDVSQVQLAKNLNTVVEDCVNAVGVDLNTASAPLLAQVSGLNDAIAAQIVAYRNQQGAFRSRMQLKKVPRLGEKTFEQAAGFLRIVDGENPLDASAVHPEAYPVVQKMLENNQLDIKTLMGNSSLLKSINPQGFVNEQFGLPTVQDILKELEKPGRDPRPEFKMATFKEGIHELKDLKAGMELQGTITNVTHFGAFIDVGVHQDGLIHKSQLANYYVNDPREIVKVGDIVNVIVIEVDLARKRVSLSMNRPQKDELPTKRKSSIKREAIHSDSVLALALEKALAKEHS